jgi:hypothetical protein
MYKELIPQVIRYRKQQDTQGDSPVWAAEDTLAI